MSRHQPQRELARQAHRSSEHRSQYHSQSRPSRYGSPPLEYVLEREAHTTTAVSRRGEPPYQVRETRQIQNITARRRRREDSEDDDYTQSTFTSGNDEESVTMTVTEQERREILSRRRRDEDRSNSRKRRRMARSPEPRVHISGATVFGYASRFNVEGGSASAVGGNQNITIRSRRRTPSPEPIPIRSNNPYRQELLQDRDRRSQPANFRRPENSEARRARPDRSTPQSRRGYLSQGRRHAATDRDRKPRTSISGPNVAAFASDFTITGEVHHGAFSAVKGDQTITIEE